MAQLYNKTSKSATVVGYKPVYIQRASDATAYDTKTQWGMIVKVNPYPIMPTPKAPYSNDWLDEDGLDEYNERLFYEAMDIEMEFYVKTLATTGTNPVSAEASLRQDLDSFFQFVRNGEFRIYDSYTGIGFRKVRFNGYDKESFKARDNWASAIVKVKFKVNDPVNHLVYASPNIVTQNYATCSTAGATAQKSVTISGASTTEGTVIGVRFQYTNTNSSPTIKLNSGTAKPISAIPAAGFSSGRSYVFEYDGATWNCKGLL